MDEERENTVAFNVAAENQYIPFITLPDLIIIIPCPKFRHIMIAGSMYFFIHNTSNFHFDHQSQS